jgi:hypothetical protein
VFRTKLDDYIDHPSSPSSKVRILAAAHWQLYIEVNFFEQGYKNGAECVYKSSLVDDLGAKY